MTLSEKVRKVAEILKQRFPNLTTEDTIDLAFRIVDSINE